MFTNPVFGAGDDPFHLYFANLENFAQGFGPMKGFARAQLELMGLMSRRAQAYLEVPSRLSHCRSPQDLLHEQMRFWQIAGQQYAESSHKIMEAWTQGFQAMGTGFARETSRQRDYISFPELSRGNGSSPPGRPGEKRVA